MSNLGLEENVFDTTLGSGGEPSEKNSVDDDTHFAHQNGTHPEEHFPEVPFRDNSGKPAKVPPIPQIIE